MGIAALKFGDLINNRTSNYVFDLRRFTSLEGKTGPYLQMAAVRMGSILDKAAGRGLVPGTVLPATSEVERRLMLRMLQLPEVNRAGRPSCERPTTWRITPTSWRPTSAGSTKHAISSPNPTPVCRASWLALVRTNRRTLALLLDLMGIEIPERM